MDTLASLLVGTWLFLRTVTHSGGDAFLVRGSANWRPAGPAASLLYEERGRMARAAAPEDFFADVKQAHLWHLRGATGADVCFSDGRPFHSVAFCALRAGEASHCAHLCPPDNYSGELRVVAARAGESGPLSLEQAWRVVGPAKDYHSVTRFWREGGAGAAAPRG
jgi:hypothetical protein